MTVILGTTSKGKLGNELNLGANIMLRYVINPLKWLILLYLVTSNTVASNASELDKAVKIYYAGYPDQAISLIQPLAFSGDVDAQFLLGNILYSLSKSKKIDETYDPVKWYKMAAAQNSPGANYALGVIYHNKLNQSNQKEDVKIAISYYEKAVDLGYEDAKAPLSKLKSQGSAYHKSISLSYTNSSFGYPDQTAQILNYSISQKSSTAALIGITKPVHIEHAPEIPAKISEKAAITIKDSTKHEHVKQIKTTQMPVQNNNEALSNVNIANTSILDRSDQTSQTDSKNGTQALSTVKLEDIANQCKNYTQSGFDYYAGSIKGAFFVGIAEVRTIGLAASKLNIYSIKLIYQKSQTMISLALNGVPKDIATELKEGVNFGVSGIVEHSRMSGSNCDITLTYRPAQ